MPNRKSESESRKYFRNNQRKSKVESVSKT